MRDEATLLECILSVVQEVGDGVECLLCETRPGVGCDFDWGGRQADGFMRELRRRYSGEAKMRCVLFSRRKALEMSSREAFSLNVAALIPAFVILTTCVLFVSGTAQHICAGGSAHLVALQSFQS